MLGDDHSIMGGSDDMKSGFVIVEIVLIWQTSYLCFWDWIWVCTLRVIYVHYIRFILSRVTVYP